LMEMIRGRPLLHFGRDLAASQDLVIAQRLVERSRLVPPVAGGPVAAKYFTAGSHRREMPNAANSC